MRVTGYPIDRVLDACIGDDGERYYLVQWRDSWLRYPFKHDNRTILSVQVPCCNGARKQRQKRLLVRWNPSLEPRSNLMNCEAVLEYEASFDLCV
jgi:hypothetical protein